MRTIDILEQLDNDLAYDETAILECGTEKTAKALYMQYSRAIRKHNFTPFIKVSRSGKTLTFFRPSKQPIPVIQKEEKGNEVHSSSSVMVYLNGKDKPAFRCHCGCNVFHHPTGTPEEKSHQTYICNACDTQYIRE